MATILEQLLAARRPQVHAVEIGGETFHLRSMAPSQRTIYAALVLQAAADKCYLPAHTIVSLGICNADGTRPTDEELPAITEALGVLDGVEVQAAAQKVLELSGLTKKAMEQAEKNAEPAGAPAPVSAGAGAGKNRAAASAGAGRGGRVRRTG